MISDVFLKIHMCLEKGEIQFKEDRFTNRRKLERMYNELKQLEGLDPGKEDIKNKEVVNEGGTGTNNLNGINQNKADNPDSNLIENNE